MSKKKFKATFFSNASSSGKLIGTFGTKEEACSEAYEYIQEKGLLVSVETREEVIDALMIRDFYMLAQAPRCLEVEEVAS